jgi:hypothetical protein
MCNVPPKFYQICRLCLSICSDSDLIKLSIFNNNHLNNDKNCIGGSDGGGVGYGVSKLLKSTQVSHNDDDDDDEFDERDGEDDSVLLPKRISKCLSIKVMIYFFLQNFQKFSRLLSEYIQ